MPIVDWLKRVCCVSEFIERDIDDDLLEAIVEAASWAPSAADAQPWEIIAVRRPAGKEAIAGTLLDSLLRPDTGGEARRTWVTQAPVLLVVCLDCLRARARYGPIGEELFGIQDTGAAIQNMRLVALEHGVKSCLIREFDRARIAEWLKLPRHVRPLVILALGYSEVEPEPKPGLPLTDYLHREAW